MGTRRDAISTGAFDSFQGLSVSGLLETLSKLSTVGKAVVGDFM